MTKAFTDLTTEIRTEIKTNFNQWAEEHNSELIMLNTGKAKKQAVYCLYSNLSNSVLGFGTSINEAITDSLQYFDNKNEECEIILMGLNIEYWIIEIEVSLTKEYTLY